MMVDTVDSQHGLAAGGDTARWPKIRGRRPVSVDSLRTGSAAAALAPAPPRVPTPASNAVPPATLTATIRRRASPARPTSRWHR